MECPDAAATEISQSARASPQAARTPEEAGPSQRNLAKPRALGAAAIVRAAEARGGGLHPAAGAGGLREDDETAAGGRNEKAELTKLSKLAITRRLPEGTAPQARGGKGRGQTDEPVSS